MSTCIDNAEDAEDAEAPSDERVAGRQTCRDVFVELYKARTFVATGRVIHVLGKSQEGHRANSIRGNNITILEIELTSLLTPLRHQVAFPGFDRRNSTAALESLAEAEKFWRTVAKQSADVKYRLYSGTLLSLFDKLRKILQ